MPDNGAGRDRARQCYLSPPEASRLSIDCEVPLAAQIQMFQFRQEGAVEVVYGGTPTPSIERHERPHTRGREGLAKPVAVQDLGMQWRVANAAGVSDWMTTAFTTASVPEFLPGQASDWSGTHPKDRPEAA